MHAETQSYLVSMGSALCQLSGMKCIPVVKDFSIIFITIDIILFRDLSAKYGNSSLHGSVFFPVSSLNNFNNHLLVRISHRQETICIWIKQT